MGTIKIMQALILGGHPTVPNKGSGFCAVVAILHFQRPALQQNSIWAFSALGTNLKRTMPSYDDSQ
jgi:hypothetical protein